MLANIRHLFEFASSGSKVLQEIDRLIRRRRGRPRLLLEELKGNQDLCVMVLEDGTDPMRIIPELRTNQYDVLLQEGFNFNSLKKEEIQYNPNLEGSDLSSFLGMGTDRLIEDIYDKIKELVRRHRIDSDNPKIHWRRRIINLYKRILLLIDHLRR